MDLEAARVALTPGDGSAAPLGASHPRVDVLGVEVSAVTMAGAVEEVTRWIEQGERRYVCVTGVHGVMESQDDVELRQIHNDSGLTTPDGMPMVWAGRFAGVEIERVYGPDLMLELCRRGAERGWRSYFYGGGPGVAEQLRDVLQARYPGLEVVGITCPPFRALTDDEAEAIVADINAARPDLVWVGLSTPKQERWMKAFRPRLDAAAVLGVGAAFDLNAGLVRQAPPVVQRLGLEWLFRMVMEPKRLWRRYARNNPRFVVRILRRPPRLVAR